MAKLGLEEKVVNEQTLSQTVERFKERSIKLPTFEELSNPSVISDEIKEKLSSVDPSKPDSLNLYRINWYNDPNTNTFRDVPHYIEIPKEISGVDAKIVVMIGANFPMVQCHKVLAAYGCLAPRVISGQFDPTVHKAIWPSTGNYCRGGVAVSRIMDCHGVAILPEEMSEERFNWLKEWTMDPATDIFRTYGCESNVKEIYDKCNELDKDDQNIIFNQFCEFGNTLIHYLCTGKALQEVFEDMKSKNPDLELKAFTSATGSAGTISAGDYLKDSYKNVNIVAVEALECPTLLNNGFGGHNIQGIGDKHVPYVHNVMNTDNVAAISDCTTDSLNLLFNTETGKKYLKEVKGVSKEVIENLSLLGLSSICNVVAAIKTARYYSMTDKDVIVTVATDSAAMYGTEMVKAKEKLFNGNYSEYDAAETFGEHLKAVSIDNYMEMTKVDKERVFNLGYYTWVEQQGVEFSDFMARKDQKFWRDLKKYIPIWDAMIKDFNTRIEE
jgi:cysteine synthase